MNWRWFQYVLPLVIWFLLLVLPFLVNSESNGMPAEFHRRFLIGVITSNLILLIVFYIHTYGMYPLLNKKPVWYLVSLVVLVVAYWYYWNELRSLPFNGGGGGRSFNRMPDTARHITDATRHIIDTAHRVGQRMGRRPDFGRRGGPPFIYALLSPMVAILCSFCYRIILDNRAKQQLLKERETAHLKSELNFLRSQISPHFMFNVLNNLVALARKKSEKLEPAIVSLSQLMRYMLYESDDYRVSLSKEVEYVKSYISLQMLRFGDSVKTSIDIDGDIDAHTIEPMLLIPFVENAFKHGTGTLETAQIAITLTINSTTRLMRFTVTNDVGPADGSKDNSSGIGIANVRRRLAILYPEKHDLSITSTNNLFVVDLAIYLTE